jgi:hypothetical protein
MAVVAVLVFVAAYILIATERGGSVTRCCSSRWAISLVALAGSDLLDLLAPADVDLYLGVVGQVAVHAILDEGAELGERHADLLVGSDVTDGDHKDSPGSLTMRRVWRSLLSGCIAIGPFDLG